MVNLVTHVMLLFYRTFLFCRRTGLLYSVMMGGQDTGRAPLRYGMPRVHLGVEVLFPPVPVFTCH